MGTKNNPGVFDCYENAEADEPMFILLARDKSAPFIVDIWRHIREGSFEEAVRALLACQDEVWFDNIEKPANPDKMTEADDCASNMRDWRSGNR